MFKHQKKYIYIYQYRNCSTSLVNQGLARSAGRVTERHGVPCWLDLASCGSIWRPRRPPGRPGRPTVRPTRLPGSLGWPFWRSGRPIWRRWRPNRRSAKPSGSHFSSSFCFGRSIFLACALPWAISSPCSSPCCCVALATPQHHRHSNSGHRSALQASSLSSPPCC